MSLQGIKTLARQEWCTALLFLITRAPISQDDAQLWLALLPLLRQICGSSHVAPNDLLVIAAKFVGGSGLQWIQETLASPSDSADQEGSTTICRLMQVDIFPARLACQAVPLSRAHVVHVRTCKVQHIIESWILQTLGRLLLAPFNFM